MTEPKQHILLPRRIPFADIELGRAYLIHARNGGVGVAVPSGTVGEREGDVGYRLHREKFGSRFLFTEWDWHQGPPYGTAIPLQLLEETPPTEDTELLAWLGEQEKIHRGFVQGIWRELLGDAYLEED